MLTTRQVQAVSVIRTCLATYGYVPTLEEIGIALGIRSKGAVHRLVQVLVDKGYVIRGSSGWRSLRLVEEETTQTLPLVGRIAAGRPIEAIQGYDRLDLVGLLLGSDRYALLVQGDSMVGAGILDGDTVVVRRADAARDGEIVVALIDDEEATLKRLKSRKDSKIELIAENPAIPPKLYLASRVRIQGVVVAQMRTYR